MQIIQHKVLFSIVRKETRKVNINTPPTIAQIHYIATFMFALVYVHAILMLCVYVGTIRPYFGNYVDPCVNET